MLEMNANLNWRFLCTRFSEWRFCSADYGGLSWSFGWMNCWCQLCWMRAHLMASVCGRLWDLFYHFGVEMAREERATDGSGITFQFACNFFKILNRFHRIWRDDLRDLETTLSLMTWYSVNIINAYLLENSIIACVIISSNQNKSCLSKNENQKKKTDY